MHNKVKHPLSFTWEALAPAEPVAEALRASAADPAHGAVLAPESWGVRGAPTPPHIGWAPLHDRGVIYFRERATGLAHSLTRAKLKRGAALMLDRYPGGWGRLVAQPDSDSGFVLTQLALWGEIRHEVAGL